MEYVLLIFGKFVQGRESHALHPSGPSTKHEASIYSSCLTICLSWKSLPPGIPTSYRSWKKCLKSIWTWFSKSTTVHGHFVVAGRFTTPGVPNYLIRLGPFSVSGYNAVAVNTARQRSLNLVFISYCRAIGSSQCATRAYWGPGNNRAQRRNILSVLVGHKLSIICWYCRVSWLRREIALYMFGHTLGSVHHGPNWTTRGS